MSSSCVRWILAKTLKHWAKTASMWISMQHLNYFAWQVSSFTCFNILQTLHMQKHFKLSGRLLSPWRSREEQSISRGGRKDVICSLTSKYSSDVNVCDINHLSGPLCAVSSGYRELLPHFTSAAFTLKLKYELEYKKKKKGDNCAIQQSFSCWANPLLKAWAVFGNRCVYLFIYFLWEMPEELPINKVVNCVKVNYLRLFYLFI